MASLWQRWHHRLASWRRLSPEHRRQLRIAALALTAVSACLRLLGYRRCHALLGRSVRPAAPAEAVDSLLRSWTSAVHLTTRHLPWGGSCLPRSLTLWWLLRRAGVASDLRIGVRFADVEAERRLEAHAWVEHAGRPINDHATVGQEFAPFEGAILPQLVQR